MSAPAYLVTAIVLLIAFSYSWASPREFQVTRKALGVGLAVLLVLAFVARFRALLPPFIVPLVLAYLLDPVLDHLEARGYSRVRAILVVYGASLALLLAVALLVAPTLTRQVSGLVQSMTGEDRVDVQALSAVLGNQEKLSKALAKVGLRMGLKPTWVDRLEGRLEGLDLERQVRSVQDWLTEQLNRTANWLAGQVSGLLWLVLLPITLFYCLRDYDPLRRRLYYLVPPHQRREVADVAGAINKALGSYLRGYAMLSLAVGLIQTTLLLILTPIFGFRYGLFMGLLAGVTYVVPYLGSLVGTFLTVAVVYVTGGHSWSEALLTWALLQAVNSLFDNVIAPRVIGKQVGLHPLVVMFALLCGGAEFGLLGVILAAPVCACIKIVLEHFLPRLSEPIPEAQTPEVELAPLAEAVPDESEAGPAPDDASGEDPES